MGFIWCSELEKKAIHLARVSFAKFTSQSEDAGVDMQILQQSTFEIQNLCPLLAL